jgi:hypothetical protein
VGHCGSLGAKCDECGLSNITIRPEHENYIGNSSELHAAICSTCHADWLQLCLTKQTYALEVTERIGWLYLRDKSSFAWTAHTAGEAPLAVGRL